MKFPAVLIVGLAGFVLVGRSLAFPPSDPVPQPTGLLPPAVIARLDSTQQAGLEKALTDAGDNAPQLVSALESLPSSLVDDALFLIQNMPHLDRLEMTAEILTHHVIYADSSRHAFPWPVPDSLYQRFILTYRLDQEPISDWRAEFWPVVTKRARESATSEDFARRLNQWIGQQVKERKAEFFGPQQTPDQTFAIRQGTRQEIASLTAALLKTAGIPSRPVSVEALLSQSGGAEWTEVYCAEKAAWLPLYSEAPDHFGDFAYHEPDSLKSNISYAMTGSAFEILDVTSAYSETGVLQTHFTRGGSPAGGFEGFTINVFNAGAFISIDALGAVADSTGCFGCRLGEGRYWVISGTRDLTGSPYVHLQPVDLVPGDTVRLTVDLTPAAYVAESQMTGEESAPVPFFSIADAHGNLRSSREAVGKAPLLLVVLYPHHEPSIRMADLIRSWLAQNTAAAPQTLWVTEGSREEDQSTDLVCDPDGSIGKAFGLVTPNDYPLVIWVDKDGVAKLRSKGYNLNIEALLEAGLKE